MDSAAYAARDSAAHPDASGVNAGTPSDMAWAATTWRFIHEYSFYVDRYEHASADAQAAFHSILRELPRILPCEECRAHLAAHLALHPLPAPQCASSCSFSNARYCVDLHNAVNVRQGKSEVPFDEVHAEYVGTAAPPACPAGGGSGSGGRSKEASVSQHSTRQQATLVAIAVGVAVLVVVMAVLQVAWMASRRG
jgi:hypothetical protein